MANTTTRAEAEAARMDVDDDEIGEEGAEDSSEGYVSPSTEPSWAKKLKAKVKALFRMQAKGAVPDSRCSEGESPARQADFEEAWRARLEWVGEQHHS